MKKDPEKGGVLQFGTEVITGADGTIAGLLGASPGASTAAPIMLDVLVALLPRPHRRLGAEAARDDPELRHEALGSTRPHAEASLAATAEAPARSTA